MTADERERRIRVRNARHATPDCLCDWCFILGRLDAERKRGDAANGRVRRVEAEIRSWDANPLASASYGVLQLRAALDQPEDDQ